MKKIIYLVAMFSLITFGACNEESSDDEYQKWEEYYLKLQQEEPEKLAQYIEQENITVEPSETGLYKILQEEGEGEMPTIGNVVTVHYKSSLLDGTIFDSSEEDDPFTFELGQNNVLKGVQEGVATMKKGEKARFIMPSSLAYGAASFDNIPPYSPLIFDLYLVEFK